MVEVNEYAYSEIFYSMQGEGQHTGEPTAWLRFYLCNLNCDGFGQKNPTDPSSYVLPYKDIDPSKYTKIEQLPVFQYGCDSSYSWAKKFKDLQHKATIAEIGDKILSIIPRNNFNNNIHMCFTGGEPLLRHGQQGSMELMDYFVSIGQEIPSVTFETNGTQPLTEEFIDFWNKDSMITTELFMSVSPKLFTVSGEKPGRAIKPQVVAKYYQLTHAGQLKFVVSGTQESWDELEDVVRQFREAGVYYPVWIMPLGATVEGQKGQIDGHISAATIADEALKRGYRVSARVHAYIYDNVIGK